MTIDEVIILLKDYSNEIDKQIVEWLEELKELREMKETIIYNSQLLEQQGYNKAIDNFEKMALEELLYDTELNEIDINYIVEQLKDKINDNI